MSAVIEEFRHFLDHSPTPWHTVKELARLLVSKGATCLQEKEKWKLEAGKRYFVQRNGSLCAFTLPKKLPHKIVLLGSHTDSPCLKIHPQPDLNSHSLYFLGTEIYGGPLLNSWLNRDLIIAGRILLATKEGSLEERLISLEKTPFFIPQIPAHLDPDLSSKGLCIDKQTQFRPLLGLNHEEAFSFSCFLKKSLKLEQLLSYELFLVPLERSCLLGISQEMLASYRLDNLSSAHACIKAFIDSPLTSFLQIAGFWDGEEIGSSIAEGASSTFLDDILIRIKNFYSLSEEDFLCIKSQSICISVDVAHGYNPLFPDKFDKNHLLIPGQGIALKYHASKKYSTDLKTAGVIQQACQKASLKYQMFVNRNDSRSGSTIGPILATKLGIPTVDIGCPIYSMHSIREVMAIQDQIDIYQLLKQLLKE